MSTHDISGRPYAKLSELKAGNWIEADKGFHSCIRSGKRELVRKSQDGSGLYISCHADFGVRTKRHHKHYLEGQADDGEHCVGIYKV